MRLTSAKRGVQDLSLVARTRRLVRCILVVQIHGILRVVLRKRMVALTASFKSQCDVRRVSQLGKRTLDGETNVAQAILLEALYPGYNNSLHRQHWRRPSPSDENAKNDRKTHNQILAAICSPSPISIEVQIVFLRPTFVKSFILRLLSIHGLAFLELDLFNTCHGASIILSYGQVTSPKKLGTSNGNSDEIIALAVDYLRQPDCDGRFSGSSPDPEIVPKTNILGFAGKRQSIGSIVQVVHKSGFRRSLRILGRDRKRDLVDSVKLVGEQDSRTAALLYMRNPEEPKATVYASSQRMK